MNWRTEAASVIKRFDYGELRELALRLASRPEGVTSCQLALDIGCSRDHASERLNRYYEGLLLSRVGSDIYTKRFVYRITPQGERIIRTPAPNNFGPLLACWG